MKDTRKDLRLRLPESSGPDFQAAKAKAERELGYTLRDNEFAVRVLVQAVRECARNEEIDHGRDETIEEMVSRLGWP